MKITIFSMIAIAILFSGCTTKQAAPTNANDSGVTQQQGVNSSNILDLSGQGLAKIPDYVFEQTNLEDLDVSDNQLTGAIQGEIRHLQNLKSLNLSKNKMTGVPAEIGQLQKLEILDLSENQLTGLPNELGNLKNLKTLDLSGNNYSEYDLEIIQKNLPASAKIIK
jgi:Leucine-rich repeat (LRR) protein